MIKNTKTDLIIILAIVCIVMGFVLKSEDIKVNKNMNKFEQNLDNLLNNQNHTCKDLFDFDYDMVYVFQPYLNKNQIEKEIGFKYWKIKETINENMMNILFIKDNKPVVYLYGYPEDSGYYIDIPIGKYEKSNLDKVKYNSKEVYLGSSSTGEKTFIEYTVNMVK